MPREEQGLSQAADQAELDTEVGIATADKYEGPIESGINAVSTFTESVHIRSIGRSQEKSDAHHRAL